MIKCYSVRLSSFERISNKCFKAIDFNGNESLIPSSQFLGIDEDVKKSEAYWISSWILTKKNIVYSNKKWVYFSKEGKNLGRIEFKHHKPKKLNVSDITYDKTLIKATGNSKK